MLTPALRKCLFLFYRVCFNLLFYLLEHVVKLCGKLLVEILMNLLFDIESEPQRKHRLSWLTAITSYMHSTSCCHQVTDMLC